MSTREREQATQDLIDRLDARAALLSLRWECEALRQEQDPWYGMGDADIAVACVWDEVTTVEVRS